VETRDVINHWRDARTYWYDVLIGLRYEDSQVCCDDLLVQFNDSLVQCDDLLVQFNDSLARYNDSMLECGASLDRRIDY
jgi:hypothetical protein